MPSTNGRRSSVAAADVLLPVSNDEELVDVLVVEAEEEADADDVGGPPALVLIDLYAYLVDRGVVQIQERGRGVLKGKLIKSKERWYTAVDSSLSLKISLVFQSVTPKKRGRRVGGLTSERLPRCDLGW